MRVERDQNGIAHIVMLSGGKDSTATALGLKRLEPRLYTYICTPTGDELPIMFEHWRKLSDILGQPIIPIMAHTGLKGICHEEGMLPNFRARFCTRKLKLAPAARFLGANLPCVSYVGLRADEEIREGARRGGDYLPENVVGVEQDYPLRRWGWGLAEVLAENKRHGIDIDFRTDCARCFYQTISEWYELWRDHPEIFDDAVQQETESGFTFRTPKRDAGGDPVMRRKDGSFEYAACYRDSWPVWLRDMRWLFELGHVPKVRIDSIRQQTCRVCTL